MNLYIVYDRVAEECGPIFEQPTDGAAKRLYRELMKDGKARQNEYKLLYIGKIDRSTGRITVPEHPTDIFVPEEVENGN